MPKYVAFLRAINVGSHLVKMADLRRLFEELQLKNVETFIASGNVIFESRASISTLESKIEKHLKGNLGYEVLTFLRTCEEVVKVAQYKPFDPSELSADGNILYIGFTKSKPSKQNIAKLMVLTDAVNDFNVHDREIYWLRRTKVGESQYAGGLFEKTIGQPVTFRGANTVIKIAAKYCG